MTYSTGFAEPGVVVQLMSVSGTITAETATLTDANFTVTNAVNCWGLESIFVGAHIAGGSAPTVTLEPLFRDENAADGARWKRLNVGALPGVTLATAATVTTGALTSDGPMVEIRTFGASQVYLRRDAVTNSGSTTNLTILGMPGRYIAAQLNRP
jgi:hypothetical protein